jgi:hypothetical protein
LDTEYAVVSDREVLLLLFIVEVPLETSMMYTERREEVLSVSKDGSSSNSCTVIFMETSWAFREFLRYSKIERQTL